MRPEKEKVLLQNPLLINYKETDGAASRAGLKPDLGP